MTGDSLDGRRESADAHGGERVVVCSAVTDEVLWDLVDSTPTDEGSDVLEHVERCPACREQLAKIHRIHEGLEAISRADEPAPPEAIGPYRILRLVGDGGMGVVYEAEQENPRRRVALKVMRPFTGAQRLRAFRREIQALGRLSHPCIATIHDAGATEDGQLYFAMELVQGRRLDHYFETGEEHTPLRDRVELFARIVEAVDHAHRHGVIHRDLKPGNVLVDAEGRPRVLDFGLARFLDPELDITLTHSYSGVTPSGTLPYMSPEQLSGNNRDLDVRTDVYALGVMLYGMVTGKLPYPRTTSVAETMTLLATQTPAHPTRVEPGVPRNLGDVVLKAMAQERARRYVSASDFAADLRHFLAGEAVTARPPGLAVRARVFVRRYRALETALVGAGGAAVLITAIRTGGDPGRASPRSLFHVPDAISSFSVYGRQLDITPDGTRIVHKSDAGMSIWEHPRSISEPVALSGAEGWHLHSPRWSPDGQRVGLLGLKVAATPDSHTLWGLFVLDLRTGQVASIGPVIERSYGQAQDLCWTPTGDGLTYCTRDGEFFTVSLRGELARWRGAVTDIVHRLAGYSPDGRWLLFEVLADPKGDRLDRELWVQPTGGGRGLQLTFDGKAREAVWDPSGEAVWCVSDLDNASKLWRLSFDPDSGRTLGASERTTFLRATGSIHDLFCTNDRDLTYRVIKANPNIFVADSEQIEDRSVVTHGREPTLSPDGDTIYHLGTADQPGLFAIPSVGGETRRLGSSIEELAFSQSFHLNSDDSGIVCLTSDGDEYFVTVVPTLGTGPSSVASTPVRVVPRWSPGGDWIAYSGERGALDVISPDGTERRTLAQIYEWQTIRWSPTGEYLAGLGYETPEDASKDNGRNAAFVVSFPGGVLRRVTTPEEPYYKEGLAWHPSGTFMSYMIYGPVGSHTQTRFAFPDARPTEVALYSPDHWNYVGVWAPNGNEFIYSAYSECGGLHVFDLEQNRVSVHGLFGDSEHPPRWDSTGKRIVWEERGDGIRHFEILYDVR